MNAGTLSYAMVAGVCLTAGLSFLAIGGRTGAADRITRSYGIACLVFGLSTMATLALHSADDPQSYAFLMRWVFGPTALAVIVVLFVLVAQWTDALSGRTIAIFGAMSAIVLALQLALPVGLLVADVTDLRTVSLFGEEFSVHVADRQPWRAVLDVYLVGGIVTIAVALYRGLRTGPLTESVILTVGMAAVMAISMYDTLVDEGLVETPYLAPFGLVALVLVGGFHLGQLTTEREHRLRSQARSLSIVAASRSEALDEANAMFLRSLGDRERIDRELRGVRESLDGLNTLLADGTPVGHDAGPAIGALLGNVGRLIDAESIELQMREPALTESGICGSSSHGLTWRGPPAPDHDAEERHEILVVGDVPLADLTVRLARGPLEEDREIYLGLAVEQLRSLLHRIHLVNVAASSAIESERQRMARELHDSVTQELYTVGFLTEALQRQVRVDDVAAETAARIRTLVLASIADLRSLLFDLRPLELETTELDSLLARLCDETRPTSDCPIGLAAESGPALPTPVKFGLFRITQEALANAIRHAHASEIAVTLERDAGNAVLVVRDDGAGFDPGAIRRGYGLHNLHERAELIGADLEIDSRPMSGTRVSVVWPAAAADREDSTDQHEAGRRDGPPRRIGARA